ncbi:uncharacterized protein LOC131225631 isoform X2 [Magnolia sinica]|uniref:uncharacterized protein LOC131225631 isoform X2 n=1 Tax=Magnolia sinica TaxID=86752 RepID=UPI002659067A|nr:uncharacterized protein LOC131225631 isoform X2 [Magnolia sinica]
MDPITQLLIVIAFVSIGILFSPETSRSGSDGGYSSTISTLIKLAHLLSFSIAWGAAVWGVLIGGIIMFWNLPRHQFGNLRSKIFPVYFLTATACSVISTITFAYDNSWRLMEEKEKLQLLLLLSSFGFNVMNLFVFVPMTIEVMRKRHKVEREEDIGEEVGWWKNRLVAKHNPNLAALNKTFAVVHGFAALATIASVSSLAMYSWYLASKIHF